MPRRLEMALRKEAEEKFPGDKEQQDTYVYGYMNKHHLLRKDKKKKRKNDPDEHDYRD